MKTKIVIFLALLLCFPATLQVRLAFSAAPTAGDDSYSTDEDTPLNVPAPGVLGNDSDTDGDSLNAVLQSGPGDGSLTLNSNGSFTYTPDANFNGSDSFTYRANDGSADSNTATVTITVNPINDPPTANGDSYTTDEDTALNVSAPGVLGNDNDPDGDSLNAVLDTGPGDGSLTLNGNGSFTYTPDPGFFGSDSFTYRANDGSADSNTATVTITVNEVNTAPTAGDDSYTTDEDTTLNVSAPGVLGNDSDTDGDSLNAVLQSGPGDGSLTLNSNGSFTYTPDANFNGSDSFTYRANDGSADSNTATVTITVNPINDPPTAVDNSYSTDEDTTLNVSAPGVLGNDSDPDGDSLNAVLDTGPGDGSLTLNSNGSFTYTPDPGFFGSDSFTYRANDGSADSNTATVTITVDPVNDPPTAGDDSYTTDEDTTLNVSAPGVLGNDSDPDGDSLNAVLDTGPGDGSLTLNSNGSFTYTPDANFNGSDSFTYRANDGSANSNVATVAITVGAVNDPPTAVDNSYSTDEDTTLNVSAPGVLENDNDPEGQPLTAVKVNNPSNGSVTLNSNGSFTYTPNDDFNGTDSFTYKANDGTSDSNTATVTITVSTVNDPPEAVEDTYTTDEDTTLDVAAPGVLENDTDPDVGDLLTAVQVDNPSNGTLVLNSSGSFTYEPNDDFNGSDSFTYKANDGIVDSNVATVTITVNPVADPPAAVDDIYTIDEDDTLTVSAPGVLGNDNDPDGDSLNAVLDTGPGDGSLTLNSNGSFTYTPNLNFNGTDSFTYKANDGTADSNVATVTITVNPVVDPPIADAGPDQTVDENTTVTLGGSNSFDTEGETLSYQWKQIGGAFSVTLSNPQTANPTFTAPSPVGSGGESLTFQLTVTDEEAAQAADTAIVNVTLPSANGPPTADAGTNQDVEEGEEVTLNGSNSFDPDGDTISYQWDQVAGPSVILSDAAAVKPTFTAPFVETEGLSCTFELTVIDTSGLQDTSTIVVNVTSTLPSANRPPEAVVGDDQTVDENTTVTLDGFGSSDPEGEDFFYRWRQLAGPPVTLSDPTAEQPTFTAPNVGDVGVSLAFEMTVTDVGGLQAVVDTLVNVAGEDEFPVADAGLDQTVDENNEVFLDGFGSFDPEGQNLAYTWRQVAGYPVSLTDPGTEQPSFTAPNVTPNGIMLEFELHVTDLVGQQQRDNVEISVFGVNDPPAAEAGEDQKALEKSTVTLDASKSSDPDVDDIMTYQWNQTGGTTVTLSDPASKLPTFQAPSFDDADGQPLIFELTVTDGQGEPSPEADSTSVTVQNFEKKNPGTSGGNCFIAAAAYDLPMRSHGSSLRNVRDRFLLTNPLVERFVDLYCTYSPPVADFIAKDNMPHTVLQLSLLPLAAPACVMLHLGFWGSLLSLVVLLTMVLTCQIVTRKRGL